MDKLRDFRNYPVSLQPMQPLRWVPNFNEILKSSVSNLPEKLPVIFSFDIN
jgi:hypothetical protein